MNFLSKLFGKKQPATPSSDRPSRSVQQPISPATGGEDLELLKQAIEALRKNDKSDEGIQALKKAIEINPRLAKAHQLLAMHYMGVQDGELAKKHFEILRSLDDKLTQELLNTPLGPLFERGVTFINM